MQRPEFQHHLHQAVEVTLAYHSRLGMDEVGRRGTPDNYGQFGRVGKRITDHVRHPNAAAFPGLVGVEGERKNLVEQSFVHD